MREDEAPSYIVDLALKNGATDVVAELHDKQHIMIRFSNNEVTISKSYDESLVSIFLMIKKHRAATTVPLSSTRNLKQRRSLRRLIFTLLYPKAPSIMTLNY